MKAIRTSRPNTAPAQTGLETEHPDVSVFMGDIQVTRLFPDIFFITNILNRFVVDYIIDMSYTMDGVANDHSSRWL